MTARWATPRDPKRRTLGAQVAACSAILGEPLMPWQRQVAEVAHEVTDDGQWAYSLVVVTVPRQAGKTTLLRAVQVHRTLTVPGLGLWTTAQTGQAARKRWRDLVLAVQRSPLGVHARPYMSAGSESLTWPHGSFVHPFAPTPKSLHGETPPVVQVDEAWSFAEDEGEALMAAIRPAQITMAGRSQLWVVSTAGDADSTWWHRLCDQGRAAAEANTGRGTAYFEWSADPDVDPLDPAALDFHPAIGHTQTLDALLAERPPANSLANYRRGFLNLRSTTVERLMIDADTWTACEAPEHKPDPDVFAIAVAHERTGAAIWAATHTASGTHLAMVAHAPGAAWLPGAVARLRAAHPRVPVVGNYAGPTRTAIEDLAAEGLEVERIGATDYAAACGWIIAKARDGALTHDGDPAVWEAIQVAELAPMAGGIIVHAVRSRGPVDALQAAACAGWWASTRESHDPVQVF